MVTDRKRPWMTLSHGKTPHGVHRLLGKYPSAVLLGIQLMGLVLYPFLGNDALGRSAFAIIQQCVLIAAVAAVRMTPALTVLSAVIGVPALVFAVLDVPLHDETWVIIGLTSTHAVFYLYTAYALIRYMFQDSDVGADEIFATGACFTVVAWAFAYLYGFVQILGHIGGTEQFAISGDQTTLLDFLQLLFLSFTTMTGTGLSDIVPVGGHARSVVMLEQLAGVNYLALVVARLLGITLARFRIEHNADN